MAGWQEAPTAPDVTDWLTGLSDDDWEDWAQAHESTPIRRTVAHRDGRTPLEYFDSLTATGVRPTTAKVMTETWMAAGGDQTTYTVTKLPDQKRPTEVDDRPQFAGFYRGGPARIPADPLIKLYRKLTSPTDEDRADRAWDLARAWREMRR